MKMKMWKKPLYFVVCAVVLMAGCQKSQQTVTKELRGDIFYPPEPDIPRLQFLKSISGSKDLGEQVETISGFEKFVVGIGEKKTEWIGKPYGLAMDDGKLYVCDVEKRRVEVLDLKNKTFTYLTQDRRLVNPVNICIVNGIKYIADSVSGAVVVFGSDDQLKAILGKDLGIKPIDVEVRGNRCYVTDMKSNQVIVIDVTTGKELLRMGAAGDGPGQFGLITDVTLDAEENVYVTDKVLARVSKFNKDGLFQMSFGEIGDSIHHFIRPKGIDVDRKGNIWVVDAAPEVAKIYNADGELLMFFGFPGTEPGSMNLPTSIMIDYDHVDLFKEYFVEGAQIEFLVLVANQYVHRVNVYGFGKFPAEEKRRSDEATLNPFIKTEDQPQDTPADLDSPQDEPALDGE